MLSAAGILTGIKYLLIFLLIILILLIVLLLLLLFVPVRYKVKGKFINEVPDGTVNVSWLLGAVSASLVYYHGACVDGAVRIFGMKLLNINGKGRKADDVEDTGSAGSDEECPG